MKSKYFFFYYLVIYFFSKIACLTNYIKLSPHNHGLVLQGCVYCINVNYMYIIRIDIGSQFTWVHKLDMRKPKGSEVVINNNIEMLTEENILYKGKEIKIPFGIQNENKIDSTLPEFQLYLFHEPTPHISTRTSIGLPLKIRDEATSFIHQYYRRNLIDQLAFSIVHRDQQHGADVYLGGIPNEAIENKTHTEFNVVGRSHLWDCYIHEVIIQRDNVKYIYVSNDLNNYAYFDSVRKDIYAPKLFFEFLIEKVYKEELAQQQCNIEVDQGEGYRQINCINKNEIKNKLGIVYLQLADHQYIFNMEHFWRCMTTDQCRLSIFENPFHDRWRLGMNFIYDSLLFDIENKKMQMYLDNWVQVVPRKWNSGDWKKINAVISSIGTIFGIFLLFFAKVKMRMNIK